MASRSALAAYISALIHHWSAFLTGGVAAGALTLLTNALGVQVERWQFWAVFVWFGLMVAGFQAWKERHGEALRFATERDALKTERDHVAAEHERALLALRSDLDDCRHALREKPSGPKLALRFDADDPNCASMDGGAETFRVKVVNDGDSRASEVGVVLSEMRPMRAPLINQRLPVMKQGEVTSFDVSPRVPVYVDVLYQRPHSGYGHTQILRVKGAQWLDSIDEIAVVLRLEAPVPTEPLELRFAAGDQRRMRVVSARLVS
jgi:hypothetical protein